MNRKYAEEHIAFITKNIPNRPFKELTEMFNERFRMTLTVSAMISLADRHGLHNGIDSKFNKGWEPTQFKKGLTPWNKGKKGVSYPGCKATQFKKGNKPHNWVPIGSERITKDGYIQVKIQEGKLQKNWRGKQVLIWEEANGPLPEGHAVIFGDRNIRNFDLDNLILVSRAQLVRINQLGLIKNDTELTRTGVIIADICNKFGERKKGSEKMSYYLGIDASLTSPGFCVAGSREPYIRSSTVKSKENGFYRIIEILNELKFKYLQSDEKPVKIAMEGLSFGSKGQAYLSLTELAGIIKYELFTFRYSSGNSLIIVPPATLKQFATGKGNCDKSAMILQAYKEFKIEFTCNDECDAFWLAQVGRAVDGHWEGLNRTKLREGVVEKMRTV